MRLRQGQHGGGIGQRTVLERELQQLCVALQLGFGQRMATLVGAGEVTDQIEFADLGLP